jgi:hypothetical protein
VEEAHIETRSSALSMLYEWSQLRDFFDLL